MSGAPLVHELRVRFAECDPQGIVFNSRYLEYFDVALTELWREAFGNYDEVMKELGVELVVAEARISYLSSLRFDDVFEMRLTITRLGTTSTTIEIVVVRDGETIAEGEMRHVFVGWGTSVKAEIPTSVRSALAPWTADGAAQRVADSPSRL